MLEANFRVTLAEFSLEAAFTARPGGITVIAGENGAGKTTLLRVLAGLQRPRQGVASLSDHVLFDTERGVISPCEVRPIGYVAQDHALFPHLDLAANVAFGLRAMRRPRAEVRARTGAALERFGIADCAARRPHEVSGGQRQRAALARAVVLEPALLLLDEPLSALDPGTRRDVRSELRRLLLGLPCVTLLVTHAPGDALALADDIVVLERGSISYAGPLAGILLRPPTAYLAEFLGLNLFEGEVVARSSSGTASVRVGDALLTIPDPGAATRVRLLLHPRDVVLSCEPPRGSARNVLGGEVRELAPEPPSGDTMRVLVAATPPVTAQITRAAAEALELRPGSHVYASFKATALQVSAG